jgi:tetratricopeptide (TPR) repeat protein
MGEVTPMREAVFRKAFSAICATTTNDEGRLPLQLGATQSFLLHTAEDVYSTRTASLMDAAREHQGVEDFNALSVSVHHLSDIYKQMRLLNKHSHLFTEVYNMTVAWREKFEKKLAQKGSAVTADDMTTYINLLKRVAENSNDYFQSLRDHRRKEEVAISTLEALDRMFDSVGTESKPFVRHMSALMLTNLGEMYYDAWVDLGAKQSSDEGELYLQLVVDKQEAAVEYFQEYLEDVDNKSIQNEYSMALQLLAIAYSNQNDMMNARSIWKRAIEKSVKITNGVEMGPYYSSLSRLYFNAAVCDMKGKFFTDAKEKLLKMMVVAINSGQVTEAQLNVKPFEGPPELKTALAMLKEISMKDPAVRSRSVETEIEEEWEDCEEGEEGCEEVFELVDTEPSKTIDDVVDDDNDDDDEDDEEELRELAEIRAQYARQSQGVSERRNMDENEEEEWEECVEGEEGCEEVEEDSEGHIIPSAVKVKVSSLQELDEEYEECFPGEEGCEELEVEIVEGHRDRDHFEAAGGDDDDEDDEELRELAEIRSQYARQVNLNISPFIVECLDVYFYCLA